MTDTTKKHLVNLVERAAATFAQAFLAIEIADQNGVNQAESLKIAGVAGALAVAKWAYLRVGIYLAAPDVPLMTTTVTTASTAPETQAAP